MMFFGTHWAQVFCRALGGEADTGLAYLKTMVPAVKTIPGALFGYAASRRLETMLRECSSVKNENVTSSGGEAALEYAIRFIVLLVAKNRFKYIDSIMQKIEELANAQKGILAVTVESASVMDSVFAEELQRRITESTGSQVKMHVRIVPELMGGYRLCIGGYYIDASLKGQMEQMQSDLESALLVGHAPTACK